VPPVTFILVQVSHFSCGVGALKLSKLLIFNGIKLAASTKIVEVCGINKDGDEMAEGDASASGLKVSRVLHSKMSESSVCTDCTGKFQPVGIRV